MALPQLADTPVSDIARRLNLEGDRREAVLTDDRNVLVLAGPGAGKTYLLVAHAAHLAETYEGRVVVLTYTRNAARELGRRITGLVAPFAARRVVACTLHAYARDLLTVHGHRIGLGHPQEILDGRDVDVLARAAAREIGATAPPRFACTLERLLRRRTLRAEDRRDSTVVGHVLNRMRQQGKLTWESCIDLAIELLDSAEESRARCVTTTDSCCSTKHKTAIPRNWTSWTGYWGATAHLISLLPWTPIRASTLFVTPTRTLS